jgi:hypothetical protein
MIRFLIVAIAACLLAGCEQKYADGDGAPGGKNSYFPPDSAERNMSQTGTSDVQIDPQTRAAYENRK